MKSQKFAFDILTVGAATQDLFVRSRFFESKTDKNAPDGFDTCLKMGAKIEMDELTQTTGGGAANVAVTFAHFGFSTSCIGSVGKDIFGTNVITDLKQHSVDTRTLQIHPTEATGTSIILLAGSGSRAILTARGASKHINEKKISWQKLSSPWMYISSLAGNEPLLHELFLHAKKSLTHIAWNPGGAEIDIGLKKLSPRLLQTDILFLNREEAAGLAHCSPRDLEKIIRLLGPMPRMALVITDGARGAYAHTMGTTWFVAPTKGKIVNTTGAGDAFGSGFTSGIMKSGDIDEALRIGALNAAGVVTHMGAQAGILPKYPSISDIKKIIIKQLP